ncbi:hypothetical protein MPTK1_4g04050 [Marchantia polymorpha subsp. ruderalis]|uniref:Uncharacterized protein n=2 Tax=Marchantia polymorpha TaxID=3197 RepID=A0AAF6B655_MARPO|nr:hypothetical protein MARPO_0044s0068 [Marchantia polymorpha]BBN07489.1 hypothetical protein Mp_4g04050 [Marchantia polymorpha subsp. ruderalis]|eukprot:PTQ39611.1 hypothetical protein MARPO_0044s0068 [Marchantia polymorpha]
MNLQPAVSPNKRIICETRLHRTRPQSLPCFRGRRPWIAKSGRSTTGHLPPGLLQLTVPGFDYLLHRFFPRIQMLFVRLPGLALFEHVETRDPRDPRPFSIFVVPTVPTVAAILRMAAREASSRCGSHDPKLHARAHGDRSVARRAAENRRATEASALEGFPACRTGGQRRRTRKVWAGMTWNPPTVTFAAAGGSQGPSSGGRGTGATLVGASAGSTRAREWSAIDRERESRRGN